MNSDRMHLGGFLEEARFSWVLKVLWISLGSSGDSKGFRCRYEDGREGSMGDGEPDTVPRGWSHVYMVDLTGTRLGRDRLGDSGGL